MYFAGIDVGSVAAKALILKVDTKVKQVDARPRGQIVATATLPTGWNPREAGNTVFREALTRARLAASDICRIVATGYGRVSLDFIDLAVTEISCHALGANYYFPGNNLVIDIGGQDSKVIQINEQGKVLNFVMNDKCAAGTGRFLQVMALTLGLDLDRLGELTLAEPVAINSMCTVFAESEVVSLLASGVPKERIVAGLYYSIARRTASLTGSMGVIKGITFTGGVAKNSGMQMILSKVLNCPVQVPEDPQIIGALGAAILGSQREGMDRQPVFS